MSKGENPTSWENELGFSQNKLPADIYQAVFLSLNTIGIFLTSTSKVEEVNWFVTWQNKSSAGTNSRIYLLQSAEHEILPFLLRIWSQPHPQPWHVRKSGSKSFLDRQTDTAQLSHSKTLFSHLPCQPLLQPTPIPEQIPFSPPTILPHFDVVGSLELAVVFVPLGFDLVVWDLAGERCTLVFVHFHILQWFYNLDISGCEIINIINIYTWGFLHKWVWCVYFLHNYMEKMGLSFIQSSLSSWVVSLCNTVNTFYGRSLLQEDFTNAGTSYRY